MASLPYPLLREPAMSDDINYQNNPLHGLSLNNLLIELVDHYGFEILYAYLNVNCFKTKPSIDSSVKFLKKTDWAREKVEAFYMYEYKNLPRASYDQFQLPPRDRIVPNDQQPGEPAELSFEDAERLREKRARKAAERRQGDGQRPARSSAYAKSADNRGSDVWAGKNRESADNPWKRGRDSKSGSGAGSRSGSRSDARESSKDQQGAAEKNDPWANWKK